MLLELTERRIDVGADMGAGWIVLCNVVKKFCEDPGCLPVLDPGHCRAQAIVNFVGKAIGDV